MVARSLFKAVLVAALLVPVAASAGDLVAAQTAQPEAVQKCMDQCSADFRTKTGKCGVGKYNKDEQNAANRCIQHARTQQSSCNKKCKASSASSG